MTPNFWIVVFIVIQNVYFEGEEKKAVLFNFLFIKESWKKYHRSQKILSSRMIYEESCDTEDWINDAENSALLHRNKLYF